MALSCTKIRYNSNMQRVFLILILLVHSLLIRLSPVIQIENLN